MGSDYDYCINYISDIQKLIFNQNTTEKNESIDNFINDLNCEVYSVLLRDNNKTLATSNEVQSQEGRQLVLLKSAGSQLSAKNISTSVSIHCLVEEPIPSALLALRSIVTPLLRNENEADWQLQEAVQVLDKGLKHHTHLHSSVKSQLNAISRVVHEVDYWKSVEDAPQSRSEREKAKAFLEILTELSKYVSSLETTDLEDTIPEIANCLDELWRLEGFKYPSERMNRLLTIIGNTVAASVQHRIGAIDVWHDEFSTVRDLLNMGIKGCQVWETSVNQLCDIYWGPSSERPWHGNVIEHAHCSQLVERLKEVLSIRSIHRQLTRLLSSSEQTELETSRLFEAFLGLKPVVCSPFTQESWKVAVSSFDKSLESAELRVAGKLRTQLRHLSENTLQALQELRRYQELLKRPRIAAELIAERQNLLSLLSEYVRNVDIRGKGNLALLDMPPVVASLYWSRQTKAKLLDVVDMCVECLKDVKGSEDVRQSAEHLVKELERNEQEEVDDWTREINKGIKDQTLSLSGDKRVLTLEGPQVVVNYNPRLGRLVREVDQLSVLNVKIPSKINELYKNAVSLVKQANTLEQIAHFHNTIGERMIPSQRPMMLAAAQALESLIISETDVTWGDMAQIDSYIQKLKAAVEVLARQNTKLAFYHTQIRNKVMQLMDTDLIREQASWKSGLRDIRDIVTEVEQLKFDDMKSWKAHWDYQLYKSLERQYQLSLASLHESLPEMKIDLVYRQQRLQFHPPLEEIKLRYYGQVRRFLAVPLSFQGISDRTTTLFSTIVKRNTHRFGAVFSEAEEVFIKLEGVRLNWRRWVALGGVALETLALDNLEKIEDWDFNFRASKNFGQEIVKLSWEEVQVGCIVVSLLPLRAEMDLQNRRYWDALVTSLQQTVIRRSQAVESFIHDSTAKLNSPRTTMEQIAEGYATHAEIVRSSDEVLKSMEETIKLNKTLASWTKEKIDLVATIVSQWNQFQSQVQSFESLISRQVEGMKLSVQCETENLLADAEKFKLRWQQVRPRDADLIDASSGNLQQKLSVVRDKMEEWHSMVAQREKLKKEHEQFGLPPPDFSILDVVDEDLTSCMSAWSLYEAFLSELTELGAEEWILFRGKTYKLDDWLRGWEAKAESEGATPLAVRLLRDLQTYKAVVPLLKYVRGEVFSDRHWLELFSILDMPRKAPEALSVSDFLTVRDQILQNEEKLQELNSRATSEVAVRQALAELDAWEVQAKFSLMAHNDSRGREVQLVTEVGDLLGRLADLQCLVQSVARCGPGALADRADTAQRRLNHVEECVKALANVQRKWVYLEPIFMNGSLALEQGRFHRVDQDIRRVLAEVATDTHVIALSRYNGLQETLNTCLDHLAKCQASLNQFLQEKRSGFPRFYFLSDEDLLELVGQGAQERVMAAHLKKLFAGIHSVKVENGVIVSASSQHGEIVQLLQPVPITSDVVEWLKNLNSHMKFTLQSLLLSCLKDVDPVAFPTQIVCLAEAINFTSRCEAAITSWKLRDLLTQLKGKVSVYSSTKVDSQESEVLALKLKAVLIDVVHYVSIVETLLAENVTNINDWHWQKQLRFYMMDGTAVVRMADAELPYTYEYQGTGGKLVRTPLTERCFLTLTQAARSGLGGNPLGPAGTGKTESVKALGALLGRQVLVFNCDEGIDVQSMGRILVGLAQCGAWGCFDEFNRLDESTLSAISMMIEPILSALHNGKSTVCLLDQEISIDGGCGLYVTLNPAGKGYGGRQRLPENLKALFRPVVMATPDSLLIAQISLMCDGYVQAKTIAQKLVELFDFCRNTLSQQQHYDWGLRALKTVLGSCGSQLRSSRQNGSGTQETEELELVVAATRSNTLSKLTSADAIAFENLLRDVFPGVAVNEITREDLKVALGDACSDLGLQRSDLQMKKCLELWEQLQQRMGVALVGPAGCGKTSVIRILRRAMIRLGTQIEMRVLNPKAMPRSQLLGQVDADTRQWTDGVLTACAAQLAALPAEIRGWLICDGDVDPEWVESLNSVLDDNRLLTLPSGARVQFGLNVNVLLETAELSHASPATVSRIGTVFLSEDTVSPTIIMQSWLAQQGEEVATFLSKELTTILPTCVDWVLRSGGMVLPLNSSSLTQITLSLLDAVTCKAALVVGLVHGLGSCLDSNNRLALAKKVFELVGEYVPDPQRPADIYYNADFQRIEVFIRKPSIEGSSLVLTTTAQLATATLQPWLKKQRAMIVSGPQGCGKGVLLNDTLSTIDGGSVVTVDISALTSPQHLIYKLRQVCVTSSGSSGRIYRPRGTGILVFYLRRLQLASQDSYGTCMVNAWLQQLVAHGGFYDIDLEWSYLERIQVVITLDEHGNRPGARLLTHFMTYNLPVPEIADLKLILAPCAQHLMDQKWSAFVDTTINIFTQLREKFPVSKKRHYSFAPRDISRWLTSIKRYPIDDSHSTRSVLLAFIYEGLRIFGDRLMETDRPNFIETIENELKTWGEADLVTAATSSFFISQDGREALSAVEEPEWSQMVKKGNIIATGSESELVLTTELLKLTAAINRTFSLPGGSVALVGRPGTGRKSSIRVVSAMHSMRLITLNPVQDYSWKNLKMDIKPALQSAGIDGHHVVLMVEDSDVVDPLLIQMLTSLQSSGETLGIMGAEELEVLVGPLSDAAAQDGVTTISYFSNRLLTHLHLAFVFDQEDRRFEDFMKQNPSLYTKCDFVWTNGWSDATLRSIPRLILHNIALKTDIEFLAPLFAEVMKSIESPSSTPRKFTAFVKNFETLFGSKLIEIERQMSRLQAGITKLMEAQAVVDKLKREAAKQEEELAEKQAKAATALDLIGETMKDTNVRKTQMERLKEQAESENKILKKRKVEIERELAEVEPLVEEARQAVGNIRSESLAEIRSLRAPPDVVRDILEGVLRLMGIHDTSWNSMKIFLAKRGVKEEIRTFDAHQTSSDSRAAVESLLDTRGNSFDPVVSKRASAAAAPLAAWVKANVKYAKVLEKIHPLEQEQASLVQNLKNTEAQVDTLSSGLGEEDKKLLDLKSELNKYTKEAAVIEVRLGLERETMSSARELVSKLQDEDTRWREQISHLTEELRSVHLNMFLSAAFITFLGAYSVQQREDKLSNWKHLTNMDKFNVLEQLSSEKDKTLLMSNGLPADTLCIENSVILLNTWLPPLLIDPDGFASEWLVKHFAGRDIEVISQSNPRFCKSLELAIRFGKILVVTDVVTIHPALVPAIRRHTIQQGTRCVIRIGDVLVDYHANFQLFLLTRLTDVMPGFDSTVVNFATTQKGLSGQLLNAVIDQERPELSNQKHLLLEEQESMKTKLMDLQEKLLQELGSAQGDILQNSDLLQSLNMTKSSTEEIASALSKSTSVEKELNEQCDAYQPLCDFAAHLYFALAPLTSLCAMYTCSIATFRQCFLKCLKAESGSVSCQKALVKLLYKYVSRSLFKSDRLCFALHLIKHSFVDAGTPTEWEVLLGEAPLGASTTMPSWIEEERAQDVAILRSALPETYDKLKLDKEDWIAFSRAGKCEEKIPPSIASSLTPLQLVLVVQALRPGRLLSALTQFACSKLGLDSLTPSTSNITQITAETRADEPVLLLTASGSDPSAEVRMAAKAAGASLVEISLGSGQAENALLKLQAGAHNGSWLLLRNLHLVTDWLPQLERELRTMEFHSAFRLWLISESHDRFSPVLSRRCLKLTYEAPPGIKKNMWRTFNSWPRDFTRGKSIHFARLLFATAWFHAIVQERRTYVPQGWAKFYEISDGDLVAAVDILVRLIPSGGSIPWRWLHGLIHQVYGGRIDDPRDLLILEAYLREFITEQAIAGDTFGPKLRFPKSEQLTEYLEILHSLSDNNDPEFFGLPRNIERSWQRSTSSKVLRQLKGIKSPSSESQIGIATWHELTPILNLWKNLHQGSTLLQLQIAELNHEDPVISCVLKQFSKGLSILRHIHRGLATLSKIIRGSAVPDAKITALAQDLLAHKIPLEWQKRWSGPDSPRTYLQHIVYKTAALHKMQELNINHTDIDLASFFHADGFLKSVKQLTARKTGIALDELSLICSWNQTSRPSISTRVCNLQIEGARFEGSRVVYTSETSPDVSTAPLLTLSYGSQTVEGDAGITFPLYANASREQLIVHLPVPCSGTKDEWLRSSAAFYCAY